MAFKNRIRLRLMIGKVQFPDERNVFRLADGSKKVQSVIIRKVYTGITDYYPEWVHQRLKIALSHDIVNIESDKYLGGVSPEGDYEIEWVDFKDYPYAQAAFKVEVTPFDATNSNCQSCEEATQLNLVDDRFGEQLDQSTEYTLNIFENDTINCSPITVDITYINGIFVASAVIDAETGILTITTKPLFFQRHTEKIITYRITCSNGGFDEADVYADLEGDIPAVQAPTNLALVDASDIDAAFSWTEADPVPTQGYDWQVQTATSPAVIVDSGNTALTNITVPTDPDIELDASTDYVFAVRSKGDDDTSQWVNLPFTTDALEESCGSYWVEVFDTPTFGGKNVTYMACNGVIQSIRVGKFKRKRVCVLQNGVGEPVSIIGADQIAYIGPC